MHFLVLWFATVDYALTIDVSKIIKDRYLREQFADPFTSYLPTPTPYEETQK